MLLVVNMVPPLWLPVLGAVIPMVFFGRGSVITTERYALCREGGERGTEERVHFLRLIHLHYCVLRVLCGTRYCNVIYIIEICGIWMAQRRTGCQNFLFCVALSLSLLLPRNPLPTPPHPTSHTDRSTETLSGRRPPVKVATRPSSASAYAPRINS